MADLSDQNNSNDLFQKSMKEALEHLDHLKDTLTAEQEKAIDLQIAAQEELKRIENEADQIVAAYIAQNRNAYSEQVRHGVLLEVVKKLVLAGLPSDKLKEWLDLSPKLLAEVWHDLRFEKFDDFHVAHVGYTGMSTSGEVVFYRNDCCLRFPFQVGQKNILAVIDISLEENWEAVTRLGLSHRQRVIEFIAQRVVSDQAPGGCYMLYADRIEIHS